MDMRVYLSLTKYMKGETLRAQTLLTLSAERAGADGDRGRQQKTGRAERDKLRAKLSDAFDCDAFSRVSSPPF